MAPLPPSVEFLGSWRIKSTLAVEVAPLRAHWALFIIRRVIALMSELGHPGQ